jgi:Carboxypeptidase regulatory-like domain
MYRAILSWTAIVFVLTMPSFAAAQGALARGTLTGTVRDASGGVLPGVTVEASSPALIEKIRTVVTDDAGIYRIVNLDPGVYTLTFTLQGFSQIKREGVELSGSATLTIPIDMRVGDIQETIVVTGESPTVDVQSTRREAVVDGDVISVLPGTRSTGSLLTMIPGLETFGAALNPTPGLVFFFARGGPTSEGRFNVSGMPVTNAFAGGGGSSLIYDTVNVDEIAFTVAGGMGENDVGGPVLNIVPRSGSNTFEGQAFTNFSNDRLRGDNLTPELTAPAPGPNLRETPGIIKAYDANISYGGPIVRDRLWFFGSYRKLNTETASPGLVGNANAFNLARWDWVRDESLNGRLSAGRSMYIGRATAQVAKNHRVSVNFEYQQRCDGSPLKEGTDGCHTRGSDWVAVAAGGTTSPEASNNYLDVPYTVLQGRWTNPLTNKLLLEAGATYYSYKHAGGFLSLPPDGIFDIGVTETSTAINPATGAQYAPRSNYVYRAISEYQEHTASPNNWNASLSYVTGSHNMKVGYQGAYLVASQVLRANPTLLSYNFTQGQPTAFTVRIPDWERADRTWTQSFFAQDTWTRGRLTLQGALRYDRAWSYAPASGNGTDTAAPQLGLAAITFPRTPSVDAFNDLSPRFGAAYDLFGTGRTAIKFQAGRYLGAAANTSPGPFTRNNPAVRIVSTVNRGWTDSDGDRVVDCNLSVLTANQECAALTGNSLNFGSFSTTNITQVNQDTLKGWGARDYDWQWSVSVQQELLPRVSADVAYSRRSFHSFTVTDNQARNPSQYDAWTINAPSDPRLPGGGGYPITLYTPTATAAAIPAQNYITWETDFGPARTSYWQGVDFTVNARTRQGLTLQFGTNTGRKIDETCATVVRIDSPDPRDCRLTPPYQTTVRGLASYIIPRVEVLVSAAIRSQPPLALTATWPVPNSVVSQPQFLGRVPPGGTAGGNTNVTLLDNEHRLYADNRRTQVDMRVAKVFRFGKTRVDVGVDGENLFNTNYTTAYDNTYQYSVGNTATGGTWNNPTAIYTPRYARLNFTVTF